MSAGRPAPKKSHRLFAVHCVLGACGGCIPAAARLSSGYLSNPQQPLPGLGAVLALIVFSVIGGVIAVVDRKAGQAGRDFLWRGMAATGVLLGITTGGSSIHGSSFAWLTSGFVSAAHAADPSISQPASVTLSSSVPSLLLPRESQITLSYLLGGNETVLARIPLGATEKVTVPAGVSALVLTVGEHEEAVPLGHLGSRATVAVHAIIETERSAAGDFEWALGSPRRGTVKSLYVKVTRDEAPRS